MLNNFGTVGVVVASDPIEPQFESRQYENSEEEAWDALFSVQSKINFVLKWWWLMSGLSNCAQFRSFNNTVSLASLHSMKWHWDPLIPCGLNTVNIYNMYSSCTM